jgi:hypothetical protein
MCSISDPSVQRDSIMAFILAGGVKCTSVHYQPSQTFYATSKDSLFDWSIGGQAEYSDFIFLPNSVGTILSFDNRLLGYNRYKRQRLLVLTRLSVDEHFVYLSKMITVSALARFSSNPTA